MSLVKTKEECELAATMLGLSDTSASPVQSDRPRGCIYASNDGLDWYEPIGSSYSSHSCGSKQGFRYYDCLCRKPGESQSFSCYKM